MTLNPLLYSSGIPPFDKIQVAHIVPAVTQVLENATKNFAKVESGLNPTKTPLWDELMTPLDDIDASIQRVWGPVAHLLGVKNSPDLRSAYESMQPKLVEFGLKSAQSRVLFDAYERMRNDSAAWKALSRPRQRIIEQRILSARLAGIGLSGEKKERFNALSQELAQAKTKFSNNVLDATKAWSMILTRKEDVSGLPEHVLQLASQDWQSQNVGQNSTPNDGPWRFTLDAPSYLPFMEFSTQRALREKLYRARISLAADGAFNNGPLIDQILMQRNEMAKLVGFDTYAEMSVASKMAGNVASVDRLLNELLEASYSAGIKEHKELEAYARSKGADHDLVEWDIPFWAERLKEERYQYSEDELRPYFPMSKVLNGMFDLVNRIFGIRVEAADGAAPIWNQDVRFFKIYDEVSKAHVASFYLDPFSRPENKRGGAWMDDCVSRRLSDSGVEIPVAYLVCNGTPAVGDKPSVMSFDEVHTLFHEFGHGLQHMLTTVDDFAVAGIAGVEWDAVELASQFMENWLYHIPTLRAISGHVDTNEPLPQMYIDKILASRNYRAATMMLRQLQFALTDMELHHRFKAGTESAQDVFLRMTKKTSALPPRPENRMLCAFSHIFAGGYSAGYYSYKWAEVLSADAYAAFEEADLNRPEAIAKVGRRYRDTVLALGGGEHPMDVFKKFRGREPSTKALLRHSGLIADT